MLDLDLIMTTNELERISVDYRDWIIQKEQLKQLKIYKRVAWIGIPALLFFAVPIFTKITVAFANFILLHPLEIFFCGLILVLIVPLVRLMWTI